MTQPPPHPSVVLVVEDNLAMRTGLARLVKMCGHEPVTAATIVEAVSKLDSSPSHVLLDMNLPDGKGTTILQQIRERRLPMKVAVLSGTTDEELLDEARSLVPDAIFRKPADVDALIGWITDAGT